MCIRDRFREDLYYLLNGLLVEIPPLRKRKEDIRSIVEECRTKFSRRYAKFPKISEDAMEALMEFPWSGNELQLETFCERMPVSYTHIDVYKRQG